MKKKINMIVVLLLAAILSGYMLNQFLKKAGLDDIFDFDLDEEIDEELF
jgi:hypothetical protein